MMVSMEEETDVKENMEEEISISLIDAYEIDLHILEAYKKTPKEFQDKLSFESFYNFHRKRIEDEISMEESENAVESLLNASKTEEKIPEDELCKNCGRERKAFDDKDYCLKCVATFREDAQKQAEEIKTELLKDSDFLKLTSEEAAKAYVGKKYPNIKNTNKFVGIKTVAKEAYQLKKMQS